MESKVPSSQKTLEPRFCWMPTPILPDPPSGTVAGLQPNKRAESISVMISIIRSQDPASQGGRAGYFWSVIT